MIFRRTKDGPYHYAFMFRGARIQQSTKQYDKNAAKDLESAHRTRLARGEAGLNPKKVARVRVSEILDAYAADLEKRGKGHAQAKSQREIVKRDFAAKEWADELTSDDLDSYLAKKRAEGYAVATAANRVSFLKSAYKLAKLELPKMRQLSKEERSNARTGFFSRQEVESICEHLPVELADFCRWAYATGMRHGSIASLRWTDIDDETDELNLSGRYTKNGAPLKLPLVGQLRDIIERRRAARIPKGQMPSALVFHRAGRPVRQFRLVWIRACLATGQGRLYCPKCGQESATERRNCSHCRTWMKYEGRIFHDFRRSAARDMIRAGVPQRVAMDITGHRTMSMFQRYNITDTSDLREALAKTQLYRDEQKRKVRAISAKK